MADGPAIYSVVILNASSITGAAGGSTDGIHVMDISSSDGGGVYISNLGPDSLISCNNDGIRIDDLRDDDNGNVVIDNLGGTITGVNDEGMDITRIDGYVRIDNAGGTIKGKNEAIEVDNVREYVFVSNIGGTITSEDDDGVEIQNVGGAVQIDDEGNAPGVYSVVVLNASEIKGAEHGVEIDNIDGGVYVANGGGEGPSLIHGVRSDRDGVNIEFVGGGTHGPIDVHNYANGTIRGGDEGIHIAHVSESDHAITVSNYGWVIGDTDSAVHVDDVGRDVVINNSGWLIGDGTEGGKAVVYIENVGGTVNINNWAGGLIESTTGDWSDLAIFTRNDGGTTVDNYGNIVGRVLLAGFEGNVFNNYSNDSWSTTGHNFFGHNNINYLNNWGTINILDDTDFKGLKLFYNGGIINMVDGDTSESLFIEDLDGGGDYEGGNGGLLRLDAHLGADGDPDNSSDRLVTRDDLEGETGVVVYNVNNGPFGFGPEEGIKFAAYGGWSPGCSVDIGDGTELCLDGDTFYISPLSPNYLAVPTTNGGNLGLVQTGAFAWAATHDEGYYDGEEIEENWRWGKYKFRNDWSPTLRQLAHAPAAAVNAWHTTADIVQTRHNGINGVTAINGLANVGGGADLAEPVAVAPPAPSYQKAGVWMRVSGAWTNRDAVASENGLVFDTSYDQSTYALLVGADTDLSGALGGHGYRVGLFGGYMGSHVDFDSWGSKVDYSGWTVGAYAAVAAANGFYGDATFKADLLSGDYAMGPGGIAADAGATTLGVRANMGYRHEAAMFGGGYIEPLASWEYINANLDDFAAGGASVAFSNGMSNRLGAGARVGTARILGNGNLAEVSLLGKLWNEFEDGNTVTVSDGMGSTATYTDSIGGVFGEIVATALMSSLDRRTSGFLQGGVEFNGSFHTLNAKAGVRHNW